MKPVLLEEWVLREDALEPGSFLLLGKATGHPRFADGTNVETSPVVSVDFERNTATTRSGTVYKLGRRKS